MKKKIAKRVLSFMMVAAILLSSAPLTGLVGIDLPSLSDIFAAKAEAAEYAVGDIIEFGSYPQSEVTDETLLKTLNSLELNWMSYGYYSGNGIVGSMHQGDWMRYADVTYNGNKYRAVVFDLYRPQYTNDELVGSEASWSIQHKNGYDIGNIYWFRFDPIHWRVLDPAKGLVISEDIIDSQPYNNTIYAVTIENQIDLGCGVYNDISHKNLANDFETSSIRSWLNDNFINTAFSEIEKTKIATTNLDNSSAIDEISDAIYYSNTTDSVFLLSYSEVVNESYGFIDDNSRLASSSKYSCIQGLYTNYDDEDTQWLLRTPGTDGYFVSHVYKGSPGLTGSSAECTSNGIRPAMCLDLVTVESNEGSSLYSLNFYKYEGELPYESYRLAEGESIKDYPNEIPIKEYHIFVGWGDENGNFPYIPETMPAQDLNLYAIWKPIEYTIFYYLEETDKWPDYFNTESFLPGERIVSNCPNPCKDGYTFCGWVCEDGTPFDLTVSPEMPDYDFNLYASWKKPDSEDTSSYTISFYNGEGGELLDSFTARVGEAIVYPEDPSKDYHVFQGWSEYYTEMPAHDVSLYAVYVPYEFEINFMTDGVVWDSKTYAYNEIIVEPVLPTKEGYTFEGWTPEVPERMGDSDITVNAVWSPNKYTVTFVIDGQRVSIDVPFGEEITEPAAPTMSGYVFKGWTPAIPSTMPAENLEFTAVFEKISNVDDAVYDIVELPDNLNSYPSSGQKYWVLFNEGLRNNRFEMSTFDVTGDNSDVKIVWNDNLVASSSTGSVTTSNQYHYTNSGWVYDRTYGVLSDKATKIFAANVDVYDASGNLLFEATDWENVSDSSFNQDESIFTYTVTNGEATITKCNENAKGTIAIPATLGGYPVVVVGDSAFKNCSSILSINMPNGLTTIGAYAFKNCDGLTRVDFPSSVTKIGYQAFAECNNLCSITYPVGLKELTGVVGARYGQIFVNCPKLTEITVPNGIETIYAHAFEGCNKVQTINLPSTLKKIGEFAFSGCNNLTDVYYSGSEEDWNEITINGDNQLLSNITIHYNCIFYITETSLDSLPIISESHYEGNQGDSRVFNLNKNGLQGNDGRYYANGNISLDGKTLSNGFEVWIARWNSGDKISWASATFDLGGNYKTLSGKTDLIKSYNTSNFDTTVYFYNGEELLASYRITPDNYQQNITVNVAGVKELKILVEDNIESARGTSFALYDMFLETTQSAYNPESSSDAPSISPEFPSYNDFPKTEEDNFVTCGIIDNVEEITNVILNGTERSTYYEITVDGYKYTCDYKFASKDDIGRFVYITVCKSSIISLKFYDTYYGTHGVISTNIVLNGDEGEFNKYSLYIDSKLYVVDNKVTLSKENEGKTVVYTICDDIIVWLKTVDELKGNIDYHCSSDKVIFTDGKHKDEPLNLNFSISNTTGYFLGDLRVLKTVPELKIFVSSIEVKVLHDDKKEVNFGDPLIGKPKETFVIEVNRSIPFGESITINSKPPIEVSEKLIKGVQKNSVLLSYAVNAKTDSYDISKQDNSFYVELFNSSFVEQKPAKPSEQLGNNVSTEASKAVQELENFFPVSVATLDANMQLAELTSKEQRDAIAKVLLAMVMAAKTPKETLQDYFAEKVIEKFLNANTNYLSITEDSVACTVVIEHETYEKIEFKFTCKYRNFNTLDSRFAFDGDVYYEIIGNIPDGYSKSGGAGKIAGVDAKPLFDAVQGVILSACNKQYSNSYCKDLDKAVDLIFGETVNTILKYTKYKSVSGLTWKAMITPFKEFKIKCPVDVFVYDSSNNLVAAIENNQITLSNEDVEVLIDGDVKIIKLYNDDYMITYRSTADSNMTVIVTEYACSIDKIRTTVIENIPLKIGTSYMQNADSDYLSESDYSLKSNTGLIINSSLDEETMHIHENNGNVYVDKKATCTDNGCDYAACTVCGMSYEIHTPAEGHTFGEWDVTEEATIHSTGKMVRSCLKCDFKEEKEYSIELFSFLIKTPTQTTINYGDSIILHADVELPAGAKVEWTADNANFSYVPSADGKELTISPAANGDTIFTAKVVDKDGKVISDEVTQTMTSKAGFFQKIIAFFKKLFGLTKVIPQAFKGII